MEDKFFGSSGHLTSFVLVGAVAFLTLSIIYHFSHSRWRKYKRSKYLKKFGGPPGHWLTGHVNDMTFDDAMFGKFNHWLNKYGGMFKLDLFGEDMLIIGEPEGLSAIMKTAGPKDVMAYSLLSQWIGQGILTSEGPHWFRNRRLLTPAFHFEVLKPYTEVFCQAASALIEKWKCLCDGKEETFEMFEHFSLMTLDSLLKTAFSTDVDVQNQRGKHPYIKAVYQISDAMMLRMNAFLRRNDFIFYYLTPLGYETKKSLKVAKDFTKDIVQRRKEEKKDEKAKRQGKYRDFVDMLLDAKDEDGNGLTDQEILDEVDTFMFAGHDTTASGLSWFMYNMARNPEHQERCREEINDVLAGKESIAWSDISKLEYLTMCIKESLRMHDPVANVGRYLTEDLKLPDGRVVPKDTYVWPTMYGVHHNAAIWENPEEFNPYRFSPENSQGRHSHAFVPFSAGPRNCIGQHFALNELKIVAALVLKTFHVSPHPDRTPEILLSLVLRSKNGVWLKIKPVI